ncbi:uncharacterized protein LOC129945287 [Eupeodes corollae]|uniref:uncharacterized protein LOC129945287 n=1 Tax=Eupeodes corollae TaxID=290404 RepID=UPI0024939838|nr:uncharacterized protein LOC129945287 [Eupeodes corollae]
MGKRTTVEQRELVLHNHNNGFSRRKIAEIVNLPDDTVKDIIHRFVFENRIGNEGRKPPNKIFSASDERYIKRRVKQNPKLSAQKLHERVSRKKPFISKKNRAVFSLQRRVEECYIRG